MRNAIHRLPPSVSSPNSFPRPQVYSDEESPSSAIRSNFPSGFDPLQTAIQRSVPRPAVQLFSEKPPDEFAAELADAIGQKRILTSILATLPGVDPRDPRFAIFYRKEG
jgi:hypothetical protein